MYITREKTSRFAVMRRTMGRSWLSFRLLFVVAIAAWLLAMYTLIWRCPILEDQPTEEDINLYKKQIATLQHRISKLEAQLRTLRMQDSSNGSSRTTESLPKTELNESDIEMQYLADEYEVIPFAMFDKKSVYSSSTGVSGRVQDRLLGLRRKDVHEAIVFVTRHLFEHRDKVLKPIFTFTEGMYRTEPGMGTRYDLYFTESVQGVEGEQKRYTVYRPSAPLQLVKQRKTLVESTLVHIILPLYNRTEQFRKFMRMYTYIATHENVNLVVVYHGSEGAGTAQDIIQTTRQRANFSVSFIRVNETFSRGHALQTGVRSLPTTNNTLLFFTDVDIVFKTDFLKRCRMNAEEGYKIYYPIVFSLYNPETVYTFQKARVPRELEQLRHSSDTGFWRDFGYGMTCQYKSDFENMQGFKKDLSGWGSEDVILYRRYLRTEISVIRSPDIDLFHIWHYKDCSLDLDWKQFRDCLQSKGRNEAAHGLLGMLAFKEELDAWNKRNRG